MLNRKKQHIWMKVTNDEYEFPLVIADSAQELADKLGITKNSIHASMTRYRKGERYSPYRVVELEEEE